MVLSAFGVVGVIGSWFFSRYYDRHNLAFIRFALLGICTFVLLLRPAAFNPACIIIVCILWGLAINSYNLAFQSEIIQIAPHGTAIAMSIYSGIYNVGIGAGALVGGTVCANAGVASVGYVGGIIAAVAAFYCLTRFIPVLTMHLSD